MQHLRHAGHAFVFVLTVHVWHVIAGEHMVGAYADVAVDKVATFVIHASSGATKAAE